MRLRLSDFIRTATIAHYGPNDQQATKVVVAVLIREGKEIIAIEKWYSDSTDVREDPKINLEIVDFLKEHNVEKTISLDRIIGCPHEEGIDYPDGQACPKCPFWGNVDRFTGRKKKK